MNTKLRRRCPRCAARAPSPCPRTPKGPTDANTYRPIRSHNEGANGRFKSGKLDIGNPKHRPAPGQVTQALLLAVMLTVANLTVLETWLLERDGPDELTTADFDASGPLPPCTPTT
ncbi:hypothetical protein [Streptomyces sp. WAC 06738]|uniref:hypothetical protein n=1 Tax=Streptomyces sp. WAC 06738 TaxID=2203210 RepID=UPI001F0C3BEA|nr:hypothetical protein [Streptomyces sp. WAC 06738]